MVTLPSVLTTFAILAIAPSPKAPPVLWVTGVVTCVDVLFKVNLIFANTPSVLISSFPMVLSRNTKLIVPLLILLEKLVAALVTIEPASTDTASRRLVSYPK